MTQQKFLLEKIKKDIKNAEFHAKKSAYFRHALLITFFGAFFRNFFNGSKLSVKFCVFDTHIEFLKEIFFALITTFL
jgi:hypothetical protein